jgi:pyridoxamine 5'-phosphate oxidase family protein
MEKISEVRQNIEKGEKFMDLYEIPFSEVIITLGMHHIEKLEIL